MQTGIHPSSRPLRPDVRVPVWLADPRILGRPGHAALFEKLLSPEERERFGRYRVASVRLEYLVTRAMSRCVLGRQLGVPPESVQFQRNPWGRPELVPGQTDQPVAFNITHCQGLIALCVTVGQGIGIDAEPLARADDILAVAQTVFSSAELVYLERLAARDRSSALVRLWTRKEAFTKALGRGLSMPLREISLQPGSDALVCSHHKQRGSLQPRWHLYTMQPTAGHLLSLAVEGGVGRPPGVWLHRWQPPF